MRYLWWWKSNPNFRDCPLIAYSGALILDEKREILYENGMSREMAARVLAHLEASRLPLVWNLYSVDDWFVKDRSHPLIVEEEREVKAKAREGSLASVAPGADVHKILVICAASDMERIESAVKSAFPGLSVVRSWPTLLEIMAGGVNKAEAVRWFCAHRGISIENAAAFGDNYNDVEMLSAVGFGIAMGNAPKDVRRAASLVTSDNDHDGITKALWRLGVF